MVNAKQPLLTVADVNRLVIQISISELLLSKIRLGRKVPVKVHACPGRTYSGTISLIHLQVDPGTRTVGLEVRVDNHRG
ncbi:MAG: efflux RND transporter periplasmic adaptor subunit [Candidatus Oleimicrobiaceae bacterium]